MWRTATRCAPARVWASPKIAGTVASGEQITLHRVKLKPARTPMRKLTSAALTAIVCFYVWEYVTFLPVKNLDPGVIDKLPDDDEDLEALFIPFPFTDKKIQPPPYAGAEEEWQNFVKFSKDEKWRQRVKDDLKQIIKKAVENNHALKRWAGSDLRVGPSWLVITFPTSPPPEFTRQGLELFGKDGLAVIREKKIDHRNKALVDRVLYPYTVAGAAWAGCKASFRENASTVAKYFGYSSEGKEISTSGPDPDIQKTLKKLEERQTADGGTASSTSTAGSSAPESDSTHSPRTSTPPSPAVPNTNTDASKSVSKPMGENISYHGPPPGQTLTPWAAFVNEYKKQWRPLRYLPPRGSLAVHGMVALDSPRGRIYIDVFAFYHPKTDTFHHESMVTSLKSLSPNKQSPRR